MRRTGAMLAAAMLAAGGAMAQTGRAVLERQVADAERAFARSMAERDHAAFTRLLSEQAVFFGRNVLNGRAEVAAAWQRYFVEKAAPFSWEPDLVVVTADGLLAHTSGPVRDPSGQPIARFNSIWRLEAPNTWRVVFDKGQPWEEPAR